MTPVERVNYIRNSVKATVDAYDGTVTLYEWDDEDPILKTWRKAFPGHGRAASEISDDLMAHLRYPEDLFKVQRTLLAQLPRRPTRRPSTAAGLLAGPRRPDPQRRDASCSRRTT